MDQDKKKVLLVDDDKFLLNMYARKMTSSGFTIETAETAPAALEKLKGGFTPDVMVIDIIMPGMDGVELVKVIKSEHLIPRAKLIMLTNESQSAEIKVARDLGIDGYIIKATTIPSEVVSKVREIMTGKQIFSEAF